MKVAVIGGGVMGAATAWRLGKRGADVTLFDRSSPPHALGSSHGESRIIRTAYFEGAWYVPLLQQAFGLWRELEAVSGKSLLTMTGALMVGDAASDVVTGAKKSAEDHGLDAELLDTDTFRARYPGHVVRDGEVAVLDRQAGFLKPEECVAAMLAQTPNVVRDTEVRSVLDVRKKFDRVVVAAGPWTPELVDWIPLQIERQVHAWLAIARTADWFAPERHPVFIRQTRDQGFMFSFPTLDRKSVKIGRHHQGEVTTPETIRRRVDEYDVDPLRLLASTYLRGVSGHVTKTLTCMYTNTPDGHFVIDFSPDDPNVVVISACSGHGFKFGAVIGDIAADLVCDGGTQRDISHFSGARFASTSHVPHDDARDGE